MIYKKGDKVRLKNYTGIEDSLIDGTIGIIPYGDDTEHNDTCLVAWEGFEGRGHSTPARNGWYTHKKFLEPIKKSDQLDLFE